MRALAWSCTVVLGVALWARAQGAPGTPSFFHSPVKHAVAGQPLEVEGVLVAGRGIEHLFVRFRVPGGDFHDVPLLLQADDLYRAKIPSWAVRLPAVEYFVEGVRVDGESVALFGDEATPVRVEVRKEAPRVAAAMPDAGTPRVIAHVEAGPMEGFESDKPVASAGAPDAGASVPREAETHAHAAVARADPPRAPLPAQDAGTPPRRLRPELEGAVQAAATALVIDARAEEMLWDLDGGE